MRTRHPGRRGVLRLACYAAVVLVALGACSSDAGGGAADAVIDVPGDHGVVFGPGDADASEPDTGAPADTGPGTPDVAVPDTASPTDTVTPTDTASPADTVTPNDAVDPTDADTPSPTDSISAPDDSGPTPGCGVCPGDHPVCFDGECTCTPVSCPVGTFCEGGGCAPCDTDKRCTAACIDCTAMGKTCSADGSACIACSDTIPCGPGFQCTGGACGPCTTAAACGAGCAPCGGTTPACAGGQCVCTPGSCGAGSFCDGVACRPCNTAAHCGFECVDCTTTGTPVCTNGQCLCSSDAGCGSGKFCQAGVCVPCGGSDPDHCGPSCLKCGGAAPLCVNGACGCGSDADCGVGAQCKAGACVKCDTANACGPSCVACAGATPVCGGNVCVCSGSSCGAGAYCDGKQCTACSDSDPNHCGPSCAKCAGTLPACAGGQCVCTPTSCGAGYQCTAGGCVKCDTTSACGPGCQPCGGATPYCAPDGSQCGQCLSDAQCAAEDHCAGVTCVPDCQVQGCQSDLAPNANKCTTAKVVGRLDATVGAYFMGDTTKAGNNDDLSTNDTPCWDAKYDQFYRLWMNAGEKVTAVLTPQYNDMNMMFKLYQGTACDDVGAKALFCVNGAGDGGKETLNHTATVDGWVTLVVDGRMAFDDDWDFGPYTLVVTLTCGTAGCCCQ